MTSEIDFDALARKANESGGAMEDLNQLFGAAYGLPVWIFIARGVMPNVNPYIASRADYENNRQMIRAFTDSKRLARFARENNLTDPDGSTQMLEVPAGEIVDYLEQFIKHDIYGVWFNSDTESDGFSIPLKQLRPIKEHLAKLPTPAAPPAPKSSNLENWGFVAAADGSPDINLVTPDGDSYMPSRQTQKSSLERWGFDVSPDESADANIKIFRPGTVKTDASLVPFYAAIILRLRDFQGSGDFKFIFNFAPEAVKDLTENITGNDHGKYFRVRRFQYQMPNASADAATIDSNELRHVQTGATISMSFTLLRISGSPTAALYFGMQGSRAEVERLLSAVTPALEAAEFVAEQPK